MKILVLTDSLGLPRDLPEEVLYEDTWVSLLSDEHVLLQSSIGGGTSFDLYKQMAYLKAFKPEIVLLQVGIVDCAPRALQYHENIFLNHYKVSRKLTNILLSKFGDQIRKLRNISYINLKNFKDNLKNIISTYPEAKFIFIGIIPASDEYENKLKNIKKRVELYNKEAKLLFNETFIDNSDFDFSFIMPDHHHLNKKGHFFLYKKIKNFISQNHE